VLFEREIDGPNKPHGLKVTGIRFVLFKQFAQLCPDFSAACSDVIEQTHKPEMIFCGLAENSRSAIGFIGWLIVAML